MLILAVESSCDETAVALVRDGRELVTDQVFSQADLHAVYGGVVPEIASRSHVEVIYQLAERALQVAGLERKDIDAVAVTYAPGLIGALLVGECFDKTARVLGLPYPGGKPLDELSQKGDDTRYVMPQSHIEGSPYDMSFSGLKTAVINLVHGAEQRGEEIDRPGLAASFCKAVSDSLVPRTMAAARELGYKKIVVAGGVAANSRIRRDFSAAAEREGAQLYIPPLKLCGDNAAMIGAQAYYEYLAGNTAGSELNAYATKEL